MNTDVEMHETEEHVMPCAEAMLAGTLALMTGHAQSTCVQQRNAMAQKIRTNLCVLAQHPRLSANFRAVLNNMQCHWNALAAKQNTGGDAREGSPAELRMWHPAAPWVQ